MLLMAVSILATDECVMKCTLGHWLLLIQSFLIMVET